MASKTQSESSMSISCIRPSRCFPDDPGPVDRAEDVELLLATRHDVGGDLRALQALQGLAQVQVAAAAAVAVRGHHQVMRAQAQPL